MLVSQKCQYGLRALFELAKRAGGGPAKVAEIAEAQAIPVRFLEVILGELKHGGFVESRRGKDGGYLLARSPDELTAGEVIRFIEGTIEPVECLSNESRCRLGGACVFMPMWQKAGDALAEVYDKTSFRDLLIEERRMSQEYVASYSI